MSRVSCDDVRDGLLAGREPTAPELVEHARGCEQCAALLANEGALGRSLATAGADDALDDALWSELERDLAAETGPRAWLRSRPTSVRMVFAFVGVLAVAALGFRHVRRDWPTLSKPMLGAWLAVFVGGALFALRVALPVLELARPRRRAALAAAFGLPLVYAFVAAPSFGEHAHMATGATSFFTGALACFSYGALLSVPLVVLVWLLDRGVGSRARVVAAAAACGLAANAALLLHCPAEDPMHLLAGHGAIGVALAFAAWRLVR